MGEEAGRWEGRCSWKIGSCAVEASHHSTPLPPMPHSGLHPQGFPPHPHTPHLRLTPWPYLTTTATATHRMLLTQSGGMSYLRIARLPGNSNVTAAVMARWVSLVYMTLAQLRVVFPGETVGACSAGRCGPALLLGLGLLGGRSVPARLAGVGLPAQPWRRARGGCRAAVRDWVGRLASTA